MSTIAPRAADTGTPAPGPAPSPAKPPVRGRRPARLAAGLVLPLALIGIWQAVTAAGLYSPSQLPPPADVVAAVGELIRRGDLWRHLAISVQRVAIGYAIGSLAGLSLGALIGLSRNARTLLAPTVEAFRTVPSLAWVPLLLLWLGIGEQPKITLVAIGAFFPVFTTVSATLTHVDPHLVEVGRAYGLRGPSLLLKVLFPAAAPAVLNGLRLGLAHGWLYIVAAELIASSMGLGFLLIDSQNSGRTDVMLVAILLLALLGKTTDALLGFAERRVVRART
jgi:sulfonate transport system permease protein